MRSGHRYGCGAWRAPHCVLWRMPSTAYCFTLTVCCVWHVSLQGETWKKAQPADHTFKVGDAVGIAHMYRPRRGSRNPYWPGRVTLCYPKGHNSGFDSLARRLLPPLQEVDGVVHLLQQVLRLRLEIRVVFAYAATLESVAIVDRLARYNPAAGHGLCRHSSPRPSRAGRPVGG